jgi:hypothetical protein
MPFFLFFLKSKIGVSNVQNPVLKVSILGSKIAVFDSLLTLVKLDFALFEFDIGAFGTRFFTFGN